MQVQWDVLAVEAQWWVTVTMVERSPFLDHPCAICTLHGLLHHFTSKDYVSALWFFNLICLYLKLLSVFLNREQVDLNMMLCPWEKSFPLSARHIFPPLAASACHKQPPNPCIPSTTGEATLLCFGLSYFNRQLAAIHGTWKIFSQRWDFVSTRGGGGFGLTQSQLFLTKTTTIQKPKGWFCWDFVALWR